MSVDAENCAFSMFLKWALWPNCNLFKSQGSPCSGGKAVGASNSAQTSTSAEYKIAWNCNYSTPPIPSTCVQRETVSVMYLLFKMQETDNQNVNTAVNCN
jgi:hypothetical protein